MSINIGDTVQRDCSGGSYQKGYAFIVHRKDGTRVYERGNSSYHSTSSLSVIKRVASLERTERKPKNTKEKYTFKTQHKARFSLEDVDISREHPYALISAKDNSGVEHYVYIHKSLEVKARYLGLKLTKQLVPIVNSDHYGFFVETREITEVLEGIKSVLKAPWDKDTAATISVTLYSGG